MSSPSVPRLLVGLKLRLMRNGLRTKTGVIGVVLGTCLALGGGAAGFALTLASATTSELERSVPVLGFAGVFLVWLLLPLLVTGTDETLEPGRLVLLPLRKGPLLAGMTLAALVGFAPLAVEISSLGFILAYGRGPQAPIVIASVLIFLFTCAVASRALVTVLSGAMASRKWRDTVFIVASFLGLGLQGLRFLPGRVTIGERTVQHIVDVVRWSPPGMLGDAIVDAHRASYAVATVELVPPAVLLWLLWVGWGVAQRRAEGLAPTAGAAPRRRDGSDAVAGLLPARFARSRRPWMAVAAKELKYVAREPRRKAALLNSFVLSVGLPLFIVLSGDGARSGDVVLFASLGGYFAVLGAMNQFGLDGPALWLDIAAGNRMRDVLIGKNVAQLVLVVPYVAVVSVVLAALTGGWGYAPIAILLALGGLGAGMAVADVVSVHAAQPLPETTNPFARRGGGAGCLIGLITMLALLAQALAILPIGAAAGYARGRGAGALALVGVLAVPYGYGVWRAGVALAGDAAHAKQPELLAAVDPRRV